MQYKNAIESPLALKMAQFGKHNIFRDYVRQVERMQRTSERKTYVLATIGTVSRSGRLGHDLFVDEFYEVLVGVAKELLPENQSNQQPYILK